MSTDALVFPSLEDAPTIRPAEHIFGGLKARWFEITDDLRQNEKD